MQALFCPANSADGVSGDCCFTIGSRTAVTIITKRQSAFRHYCKVKANVETGQLILVRTGEKQSVKASVSVPAQGQQGIWLSKVSLELRLRTGLGVIP